MIYISGMMGLGDNIYQRAFIKSIKSNIYLRTPWPEIYKDMVNVFPVRSATSLRTQAKNEIKSERVWHKPENITREIRCFYQKTNIFDGMADSLGVKHSNMDLPDFGKSIVPGSYYVIRPVTVRREWPNESRNPLPEYLQFAAKEIRRNGGFVVSVADLQEGAEWPVGEMPESDLRYHHGELSVSELMALCQGAKAIIGGIGWIVPASMAMKKPAFVFCGGQGAYNSPDNLTHKTIKHKIAFAVPDNMCMCNAKDHKCDKRISNYERKFSDWLHALE